MPNAKLINPPALGKPRGYSNGVLASPGSSLLFVAGQIAWNEHQQIVSESFAEQFRQALANVVAVVRAAGGAPEHLGQLTLYVTDKQEYLAASEAVGRAYQEIMGRFYPAMALVEVKSLLEPAAKVEIQALAAIPQGEDWLGV
jgi:enamine deaminase RidA (YjgF/YER057c/UK114 family)